MKKMSGYNNYNYELIDANKMCSNVSSVKYEKYMFGEDKWIPVNKIKIDIAVQRELQDYHVAKLLKKFDPQAFGRLTVSLREDGYYYCSDGQHRLECAKQLGLKEVPCVVVNNSSLKEEGESFIKVNEVSAKVSALDKYRIGVSSEILEWLRVKECLDFVGLEAGTGQNKVSCLSIIYKTINSATLLSSIDKNMFVCKRALYILKHTVGAKGITNQMYTGMSIFVRHYILSGETDVKTTIDRLSKIDYKAITSKAQDMKENSTKGKVDSYVAYLFWVEYNKGYKVKLPLKIEI